jgi:hypothetical protein
VIEAEGSTAERLNRRGGVPRRFALGLAGAALVALAAGLVWALGFGSKTSPASVGQAQGDPLSHQLFDLVAKTAKRAPGMTGLWSHGNVRVLTATRSGGLWRLAYGHTSRRRCVVLVLPNLLADGTCGNAKQVSPRPVLVYGGSRPDPRHPRRVGETVVYGMVSPAVRTLRLGLSDCSTTSLSLGARPLFLAFVEQAKLRRGASPTSLTATLSDGRTVRRSLAPRDACRRP